VIVRANVHNYLALLTESPTAKCSDWEEAPKLHVAYEPMIEKIKHLMRHGMSVMMVLHDFLLRSIAPLQDCACPTLMYTGEGDTTQQEHGRESDFTPDVLDALLGRLSPDPSSVDFITPPVVCAPMSETRQLKELPTLDNIDIVAWQRGDESQDIQIPGADVASGQGGLSIGLSSGKGKRQGGTSNHTQ
jgi:hypothetical protein